MLPRTEKGDSFTEFFSDVEARLRAAFTATFGIRGRMEWTCRFM